MVYSCWLVVIGFKKRIKIDNFSYNINNIIYRWFLGLKLMCLVKLNCVMVFVYGIRRERWRIMIFYCG